MQSCNIFCGDIQLFLVPEENMCYNIDIKI